MSPLSRTRASQLLVTNPRCSMTTQALCADSLCRCACGYKILRLFDDAGRRAHPNQERLKVCREAAHGFVSRQPIRRRHRSLEVAIVEGVIEIVEMLRVRMHVIQEIRGAPILDLRRGRFRFNR